MTAVIEMKGIDKQFGDKTVLSDIHFSVDQGEIFGLLGPSGAGKTTIINILTGQIKPTGGKAALLGVDSTRLTDAVYAHVGMVLDESGVYQRLSVADNMIMFADIYGTKRKHIATAIEKVGLQDAMKKPVEKLSKGMRQRLILARAILHQPKVLFLDEPTSGLDPGTSRSVHQLILEQQAGGCTIFLTTHNMEEASLLCNSIALLNEGKKVEQGSPEALCRKYHKDHMIKIETKDGQQLELPNTGASARQIARLFSDDLVDTIHSSEPNLESVFITLTGRKLA